MQRKLIEDIYVKPKKRPAAVKESRSKSDGSEKTTSRPPKNRKQARRRAIKSGVLSALILVTGTLLVLKSGLLPDNKTSSVGSSNQPAKSTVSVPGVNTKAMADKINAIIEAHPSLNFSVAFKDISSLASLNLGRQEPYIAASISKLLTASLFLYETEEGRRTLEEQIAGIAAREQLRLMIEQSDNASWALFNNLLGLPALEAYAKQAGMQSYNAKDNTGTSSDFAVLLEGLYSGKLLSQENSALLLSFMQNASERQYIAAALPEGFKVYHKAGYLEDRAHDAAIVDNGKNPFILVIFSQSEGVYDFSVGRKAMHEITAAILQEYK